MKNQPKICSTCGTPLDQIPLEKCYEHEAYFKSLDEELEPWTDEEWDQYLEDLHKAGLYNEY